MQCWTPLRRLGAKYWQHLTLAEVSGSLGDLGTFLPLVVGLVKTVGLDLGTTLLFTGVYNIITGLLFDIPMPVQPMKTIAAVALAETGALDIPQIMAAGIFVSSCILFLGATGLMGVVARLIPMPVIRGMQLGLGLSLASKGVQQVWYTNAKAPPMRQWWTVEGFFLGLVALAFILVTVYPMRDSKDDDAETQKNGILKTLGSDEGLEAPLSCDAAAELEAADAAGEHQPAGPDSGNRVLMAPGVIHLRKAATRVERFLQPLFDLGTYVSNACGDGSGPEPSPGAVTCCVSAVSVIPAALIVVILGIVLAMIAYPSVLSALSLGPSRPQVVVPSSSDWRTGILRAGLPQLALTAFNSVISVCQLSAQLFPDRPARPSSVATSVGLMNLVGCWFGAMPCCHGSGGLASQVRFGARWGTAPIVLGMFKIFLSLLLGSSLFQLLQVFPSPLLGAMLVYAGMELAAVAKGQKTTRGLAIMLITAAITLGINNVAIGVASGLAAAYLLALRDWVVEGASQAVRGTKVLRCCAAPRAAHDEEV